MAENPPLDDGGLLESMDTFRVAGSAGLVLLYGTVFTRVVGERRPISNMLGESEGCSSCERSLTKRTTRKSSCATKDNTSSAAAPPRNPSVLFPSALLPDRQMSVATVKAAATTQRTTQEPNHNPLIVLEVFFLLEMMRIHDNRASTADSSTDDIIAVIRVDDVGFERGNARMIWRINKINEAVTATAPSTAEANGRDMLITLILVLDSYVRNDEFLCVPGSETVWWCPGCETHATGRGGELARTSVVIRRSCRKIGKRVDEGRSASQKPKPNKARRSPENKSPACSYYSVSDSCAPKFQNRTKIVPLKVAPSAPVGKGAPWVPKETGRK